MKYLLAVVFSLMLVFFTLSDTVYATIYEITYTDTGFSPASLNVKLGDSATFRNLSETDLTVATHPQGASSTRTTINLGTIIPGTQATTTFTNTGTHVFLNQNQPRHTGYVTVIEARTSVTATASGAIASRSAQRTASGSAGLSSFTATPSATITASPSAHLEASSSATATPSAKANRLQAFFRRFPPLLVVGIIVLLTILLVLLTLKKILHHHPYPPEDPTASDAAPLPPRPSPNLDPKLLTMLEDTKDELDQWIRRI